VPMTNRATFLVFVLAAGLAGCDDAVDCELCSAGTHRWASTDSNGLSSLTSVWTNPRRFPTSIWIGKDGYADPEGLPKVTSGNQPAKGWREVVVDGDTRVDVQLVRR
jgi:hypothetical protein